MNENSWQAPALCKDCLHLTIWLGRGYGCGATYSKGPLENSIVCKGFSFVQKDQPRARPRWLERLITR